MLGFAPLATRADETTARQDRAYALLAEVWKQSEGGTYYARDFLPLEFAPYDPDRALKLAAKPDGTTPDMTLAWTVMAFSNADAKRAVRFRHGK